MDLNTPPEPPASRARHAARRRRMLQMTFVGLAAGVIGGGIVFGVDHVTSTSSPSASASTPSSSQGASGGVTPASGGGSGGSSGGSSPYSGGSFGAGGASGGSSSGSSVTGSGAPSDVSAIAAKVDPGLVDINSSFSYQSAAGAGTGIVVTSTGEVITNNHVINGATTVSVTDVGNGKTYKATVVGYDETDDIAVLQLQAASGLSTATLGDSSTAAVGESIVAIGNAGGAGGTPSTAGGSITGLDQSVTASDALDGTDEQLSGLLGVNADVQPGDSGGSLVNSAGQVLGIDTAGSSGSSAFAFSGQTATSQAYAIPINTATSIADQIESDHGTSTIHVGSTAFLGIETSSRDSQSGSSGGFFGGSGDSTGASGVTVAGVVAGGAAAHAGLAAGDVITSFDGQTVASASTLTDALVPLQPGDKVQVSWTDTSGQSHTATVALGSGPPA